MRTGFVEGWVPPKDAPGPPMAVVVADNRVVGAASIGPGRLGPSLLRIGVMPDFRGRGVGTALFDAVTPTVPPPYFVREMQADPASLRFYEQRGFVLGETALEGTINTRAADTAAWIAESLGGIPDPVRIAVPGDNVSDHEIAAFVAAHFVATHPWMTGLERLPESVAMGLFLSTTQREAIRVATTDGDLVGVAMLGDSPFDDSSESAHLAWAAVALDVGQPVRVVRGLVASALDAGNDKSVTVECNSANHLLWNLIESIPGVATFVDLTILVRH